MFKIINSFRPKNITFREFGVHHLHGPLFYKRRPRERPKNKIPNDRSKWLEGKPFQKGVCLRVFVRCPKKPNSGLRKMCRVKMNTGKEVDAFIPGIGHNLTVHSVVVLRGGYSKDLSGCNLRVVRGKFDCLPVKDRFRARSKYGAKLPAIQRYDPPYKYPATYRDRIKYNLEKGESMPIPKARFLPKFGENRPRKQYTLDNYRRYKIMKEKIVSK
eukprot:GHVL01007562.1.p1 GENE.GHVL01007562.1~~GHVL01007562.1.p1  ORF type:complete len:234 (+),score=34.90 GHVL01007562.1:60-704(+)